MRLDTSLETPVPVPEASRRALEVAQVARERPDPEHEHQRYCSVEQQGQQPIQSTPVRAEHSRLDRNYVRAIHPTQRPDASFGPLHVDRIATRQLLQGARTRDIRGGEQLHVDTGLSRQIGDYTSPLRRRYAMQSLG